MDVDSSFGCIWVCSSVRETATGGTQRSRLIARHHGVQRPTEREREWERVCMCVSVSLCNNLRPDAQASHWGDWVSRTGYWKDPQCRCLCVSASMCAKEDLGTCTSLGSCVPRCQKLESLGSRGVYCIDSVSLTAGGTHLAYVYLFTLMNLYPYQAQGLRGWGHMCWDFFGAECFYSFWSV